MSVKAFSNPAAGKPEGRLYDYLLRVEHRRHRRTAIQVHISRLQAQNRRDYNLRIAAHVFDNLLGHDGEVFVLSNNDIVFIAEGVPRLHIDRSLERLRGLFSEDPLIYFLENNEAFCTWYNLETDYNVFLAHAKSMMNKVAHAHMALDKEVKLNKLDAKSLSGLENVLNKADISNFVRNQAACLHVPGKIEAVFDELYVSIPDLQRSLIPDNDLRGNKWLFQYLTEVLDRRMLAYLSDLEQRPDRKFSINLNVSTVLSHEFQAYDRDLTAHSRGGNLVVELQKHDIFSDMGAYLFAREYLQERTHKICLDGITHLTLPYIDHAMLKLDLIKLCWSTELLNSRDRLVPALREHIDRIGAQRFILIHCDTPDALDLGTELGISMFQGRYVSHLLARTSARRPPRLAQ